MKFLSAFLSAAVAAGFVALAGCVTVHEPPKEPGFQQVQFTYNVAKADPATSVKSVDRGAVSGRPQDVGFFYAVNPDCTSTGLVRTSIKTPAAHGSVSFVETDGYPNFPASSAGRDCNKTKSPGIEVVYTSASGFTGTDQFTVQGIGPKGAYIETSYRVTVIAP